MVGGKKTGCGIVTFNRPHLLLKLYKSLPHDILDVIHIVNDGEWYDSFEVIPTHLISHNARNLGVGKSKNKALQHLLDQGCEHIFLIEDDIFIKDVRVFEAYVEASNWSGVQHLNFSQHGRMNKTREGAPKPVASVSCDGVATILLYRHCVGAFSYYTRHSLLVSGLMDTRFHNALEHVDHTLEIIKRSMHPPFWYFADIVDSGRYIGDEEWSLEQSTISSGDHHQHEVAEAVRMFTLKHGCAPSELPLAPEWEVRETLLKIKDMYGERTGMHASEEKKMLDLIV